SGPLRHGAWSTAPTPRRAPGSARSTTPCRRWPACTGTPGSAPIISCHGSDLRESGELVERRAEQLPHDAGHLELAPEGPEAAEQRSEVAPRRGAVWVEGVVDEVEGHVRAAA